jgi:hypothetical protein
MEPAISEPNGQSETITPPEIVVDHSQRLATTVPTIGFVPTSSSSDDIPPPKPDFYAPPPYEVATKTTKLPTYEEVQREKNLEEQNVPINAIPPTRVRLKIEEI